MIGDLVVGQCYPLPIPRFSPHASGAVFSFGERSNTLALYYSGPTLREIRDFRAGDAGFALLYERGGGGVVFLLYRFGGQPWNAVPYSVWHTAWQESPEEGSVESLDVDPYASATDGRGNAKVALETHLVDTLTGLLMGRRVFSLPEEFVLHLEEYVDAQVGAGRTSKEEFEAAVENVHRRCEVEDLVARAKCTTVFRHRGRA